MNTHHPLTLFLIKKFYDYDGHQQLSNGLRTSAMFVVDMLLAEGHRSLMLEAIDGNSIDALVAQNKPTRVVLEAIWVTPAKMAELQRLHPRVKWTVRIHSATPFLAQEGCAVAWIAAYIKQGIEVAFNSAPTVNDFSVIGKASYLPNYYPMRKPRSRKPPNGRLDIGCFGAIRPLKNQLIQAVAAVHYAKRRNQKLAFHVNDSRVEQNGGNNLKNIQALLAATGGEIVHHPWLEHGEFLELIATMDICLQVSLSESFNLVSADAVSMGVPLVGSEAISWLPERSQADVGSAESICEVMQRTDHAMVLMNQASLKSYLRNTVAEWNRWIQS